MTEGEDTSGPPPDEYETQKEPSQEGEGGEEDTVSEDFPWTGTDHEEDIIGEDSPEDFYHSGWSPQGGGSTHTTHLGEGAGEENQEANEGLHEAAWDSPRDLKDYIIEATLTDMDGNEIENNATIAPGIKLVLALAFAGMEGQTGGTFTYQLPQAFDTEGLEETTNHSLAGLEDTGLVMGAFTIGPSGEVTVLPQGEAEGFALEMELGIPEEMEGFINLDFGGGITMVLYIEEEEVPNEGEGMEAVTGSQGTPEGTQGEDENEDTDNDEDNDNNEHRNEGGDESNPEGPEEEPIDKDDDETEEDEDEDEDGDGEEPEPEFAFGILATFETIYLLDTPPEGTEMPPYEIVITEVADITGEVPASPPYRDSRTVNARGQGEMAFDIEGRAPGTHYFLVHAAPPATQCPTWDYDTARFVVSVEVAQGEVSQTIWKYGPMDTVGTQQERVHFTTIHIGAMAEATGLELPDTGGPGRFNLKAPAIALVVAGLTVAAIKKKTNRTMAP